MRGRSRGPRCSDRGAGDDGATQPIGLAPAQIGPPRSRVNQWRAEFHRGCAGAARGDRQRDDDELCVPGGTFWFGDHQLVGLGPLRSGVPERPVAVSPFFMDRVEYTVGRYRAALRAGFSLDGLARPASRRPAPPDIDPAAVADDNFCPQCACNVLDDDDGSLDRHPLNCVTAATAAALCRFEGRRLPTEAEWEWAAGGRDEERRFVWGDAPPSCGQFHGTLPSCAAQRFIAPSVAVGSFAMDRARDGLLDLTGNVSEFTSSQFQPTTAPCWSYARSSTNPDCALDGDELPLGRTVKGAHSAETLANFALVSTRRAREALFASSGQGFRCARDDR